MTTEIWNIELLGRLSASREGRRITRFGTEKAGLLLACLAQEPGRGYWRDELAMDLWPDNSEPSARNCLRIALCFLRDQLEHKSDERGRIIVADRAQIYLDPGSFTTDKLIFESSLADAANADDPATRIQCLERAIESYGAGFLPEFETAWITAERRRLTDAYLMALRRLVWAHLELRHYPEAIAVARRAVIADPSREEAHRLLMDVYSQMGRPSAALRQYQQIQAAMARATVAPAPDASPDLAERAVSPTQRDRQDADSATSSEGREDRTSSVERLVGRRQVIQQICDMLDTPETRLLTLTGPSGIGKSSLAAAVVRKLKSERVRSVDLTPLTDAFFIVASIAAALGVEATSDSSLRDALREALAKEKTTLILDGIDALMPEAGETISRLLEENPTLELLVTCRNRLNVPGEYEYAVKPLPVPTVRDRDELATVASCRLWLALARAIRPGFRPTPPKSKAIVALCRRLDGVPMAIELTAAWADSLTPAHILVDFLDCAGRVPIRQPLSFSEGTTREVIDWSVLRLAPVVRQFLARLSVFRGGFTADAAEAVCQQEDAAKHLGHLSELTLVQKSDVDGRARYSIPESVREYAAGNLTEADQTATQDRHREYFAALAAAAEVEEGGSEAAVWLSRLGHEVHNFRAALHNSLHNGRHDSAALRLSSSLFWFWYIRGEREEGQHWISAALANCPTASESVREKALTALGNFAYVSQTA